MGDLAISIRRFQRTYCLTQQFYIQEFVYVCPTGVLRQRYIMRIYGHFIKAKDWKHSRCLSRGWLIMKL